MIYVSYLGVALLIVGFMLLYRHYGMKNVKEWLLIAVTKAEKELGNDTGKLKLKLAYDYFIDKFPLVSKLISFDYFSTLVKEALNEMNDLLKNDKIKKYIQE